MAAAKKLFCEKGEVTLAEYSLVPRKGSSGRVRSFGASPCQICSIVVVVLASVFIIAEVTGYVFISRTHHTSTLAIASDVIECAKPSLLYWYNNIVINEVPLDSLNDNPKGLIMDVFTLKKTDIQYHAYLDHRDKFELILPTTGMNRFIMPYEYYNRPWYLWAGSTIDIKFNIKYKEQPTKAIVYLFKGEKNINLFFSQKNTTPKYERQTDMLALDGSNSVHWSVKHNDYYYVAVHTVGSMNTIFKANLTFNFTYIDVDDYSWIKDTAQRARGVNQPLTLYHSFSSGNSNLTLCYLHALPTDSLDSNSIHITTDYNLEDTLKALLLATLIGLLLLYFICVLGTYLICLARGTCRSHRSKGYVLIN